MKRKLTLQDAVIKNILEGKDIHKSLMLKEASEVSDKLISTLKKFIADGAGDAYLNEDGTSDLYIDRDEAGSVTSEKDLTRLAELAKKETKGDVRKAATLWYFEQDFSTDYDDYYLQQVIDACDKYLSSIDDEDLYEEWDSSTKYDVVMEAGYNGVDASNAIDYFSDVRVDILLGTSAEKNSDFGAIADCFKNNDDSSEDNMLAKFVKAQGYSVQEIRDAYESGNHSEDKFIDSVVQELLDSSYSMGTLTVLATLPIDEFVKLKNGAGFTITPHAKFIGIFNPWQGAGGSLNMIVKKAFPVSANEIYAININDESEVGYSVDDVYGLTSSAWSLNAIVVK